MPHMVVSPPPAPSPDLLQAQGFARVLKVHSKQCRYICTCIEKALSSESPIGSDPESGQQWDDTLSNIIERFSEWSKLDIVQSYLRSDHILAGIDWLFSELRWCGMQFEDSQLSAKRMQDTEQLEDSLRTIVSNKELLNEVLAQQPELVRMFIKKLQHALIKNPGPSDLHSKLEYALMLIYKKSSAKLLTPDLTSQITDVESVPTPSSPLFKTYQAYWLDDERVAVRAMRLVRYTSTNKRRFPREVAEFYSASIHPNIVRVYGTVLDEGMGCCLVIPMSTNMNVLSYLQHCGDTNVAPWLYDIASGMQHLHSWVPPVICGCLRAENIWIKDDGASVCISDFGLFQLSSDYSEVVNNLLRWCAPEIIRATKSKSNEVSATSLCSKQTDIYSFGIIMFGKPLFTSEIPLHHIIDDETLEPEILHGARPIITAELKTRAHQRGLASYLNEMMKACWDPEPMKRPGIEGITGKIAWNLNREALSGSGSSNYRPASSSGTSIMSRASRSTASSGHESALQPLTPRRSSGSLLASGSASIASVSLSGSPKGHGLFSPSQLFSEPASIELGRTEIERKSSLGIPRQESTGISRQISSFSLKYEPSISEDTIRQEPRSSFSSDSEDRNSHLGQRESTAYERMPKLKAPSLLTDKGPNKNRFEILTSRMTVDGRVNPNWVGVSSMEGLRGITRRPGKLTQVSAVENLVKRENEFLSDTTDKYLAHRLRSDPGILGISRLEVVLSNVLEDSRTLRMVNEQFRDALQANSDVMANGFSQVAFLCKEAALQFAVIYPAYIQRLPEVRKTISDEIDANEKFSEIMNEKLTSDNTLRQALDKFLYAPVKHLEPHSRTLQLIISEMSTGDPEKPLLQDALVDMLKAINLVHVSAWQRSESTRDRGWKDFVSKETVKGITKTDVTRQTLIFELIAEERAYVGKLKVLQKILQNVFWELNAQNRSDAALQEIMKSLIAVVDDFCRFHPRLLENLFTLQRSQHPLIGTFVTMCGVDQIPFYSLYNHRFGSAYQKLVRLIQEGKARTPVGIFKRVMQEQSPSETDFMQFLRTPSTHLRLFVNGLKKIAESTSSENDDRQTIYEIFPRLSKVCQQVDFKTSASKERALLSSFSDALDFNNFPGVENDIDISSSSRTLIMSGNLKLGVASSQMKRVFLEERFALLLDNYLIFTRKTDNHGGLHLEVCEKPLPLDLIIISNDGIPSTSIDDALYPCLKIQRSGYDPLYLYTETDRSSRIWRFKLEESRKIRASLVEKTRVIDLEVLHRFARVPSCSAEFLHAGETIVIIACEQPTAGIWMRQGRNPDLRLAISLNGTSQITVLDEQGIILVLAEKSLNWCRQDELMKGNRVAHRPIDESMIVNFYRTGVLANRSFLVVSARRKGKDVLRFYDVLGNAKSSKVINAFKNKPTPFNLVAETELSHYVKDVQFLKSTFVLISDAFQLVNFISPQQLKESLSSSKPQILPRPDDPLTDLAERCRTSGPIAIQRFDKDFMLCYRDFAVYVNENGLLSPNPVEWESNDVQSIVFRSPYVLALGASTVEVRQISNGKLVQLLAVPGTVHLAMEKCSVDNSQCDLGVHIVMGAGSGTAPPDHWYSLDNSLPYTLFRLSRH